ncbi:MAG: protein-L-isoaspartate(D-aspartate) O-methyltransferase [Gammaproteobacteria bacterium]|nr:protein-L-isoaspartate(D-aspartate) O-methyltransferase [Gammaproteobacteria bacterium]
MSGVLGAGMTSQRTRTRLIERLRAQGIADEPTLQAIGAVPRHLFVDEALASRAYEDTALPIGHGQTISQPYIVARMTALLRQTGSLAKVLEIGTGSGYQAAVLAHLAGHIYTVERVGALLRVARKRFASLNLQNIHCRHTDGSSGWAEAGPFDAIIVTAAAREVPEVWLGQLRENGRLVAPVGIASQALLLYRRHGGEISCEELEGVNFVPLLPGGVV